MGSCAGCQLDVLGGLGPGSHLLGCQRRTEAALPSAGSPATNTWTGSPGAGQLSELWFLLRLRVWPRVEKGEPGAAAALTRLKIGSPLGWGCGFKGMSGKASSRLGQKRCFLEEGGGSREHSV